MAIDAGARLVVDPPTAWSSAELWDREYSDVCAIPSSHRTAPAHSFVRLEPALRPAPGVRVLDAGSGTGRHALYLARMGCSVHAVDVSETACDVLSTRVRLEPDLAGTVTVEHARLGVTDLPDARYDLVIDSYVSCHLLSWYERLEYLDGLRSLLRPGGVLYTACMGAGDEYYATRGVCCAAGDAIMTDPLNGITKLLQPHLTFRSELSAFAPVAAVTTERFFDKVAGSWFRREVLAAAIQG